MIKFYHSLSGEMSLKIEWSVDMQIYAGNVYANLPKVDNLGRIIYLVLPS